MPDSKFLEEYPLYKKFEIKISLALNGIPKPSIHMFCGKCNSEQTFRMINDYFSIKEYSNYSSSGEVVLMEYICASCNKFRRYFLIKISDKLDYIMKVGQYLPWDISIDKNLTKMLGEHEELFKKGLICESQGYGIGAYSYYRRIIELIINELLDSIYDLIEESENKLKYKKALDKTKEMTFAKDKINLVKDLLPPILRPNNINPLSILYERLSEGIHEKTDEECMEIADDVKKTLLFLVNQVILSRNASKEFSDGMKKLLEKKANS